MGWPTTDLEVTMPTSRHIHYTRTGFLRKYFNETSRVKEFEVNLMVKFGVSEFPCV